ncbi:dihydrofolate reductase [Glutamicibacter halophytocola]|uniref:Dihydrofolate reductase n=2 Tax=Glutamicibacter halophytocola TaxID=1933880 RepID=A0ABX5Y4J8_9MICC|nr:dihydrofolate reductase [Glutamicibacter halophytocola]
MGPVTCDVTVSSDGFCAGPHQSMQFPLGEGAEELHRWQFERTEENAEEIAAITEAAAFIMGSHMFGPPPGHHATDWTGWWGDNPPYHAPVFVLSTHPRPLIRLDGGTSFQFVTEGIHEALSEAQEAAGEQPVAIAGGANTIVQFLNAGLIDELRLHIAPIKLGRGEAITVENIETHMDRYSRRETTLATHVHYRRRR